jgi:hypothetical protein
LLAWAGDDLDNRPAAEVINLMTTCGKHLGKEKFHQDATFLLQFIQSNPKNTKLDIAFSWARLCAIYQEESLPLLETFMPHMLGSVAAQVEEVDDEGTHIFHHGLADDKVSAIESLGSVASSLDTLFSGWTSRALAALIPTLRGGGMVQARAAVAVPLVLNTGRLLQDHQTYLNQTYQHFTQAMLEVVAKDDPYLLTHMLKQYLVMLILFTQITMEHVTNTHAIATQFLDLVLGLDEDVEETFPGVVEALINVLEHVTVNHPDRQLLKTLAKKLLNPDYALFQPLFKDLFTKHLNPLDPLAIKFGGF